jgi:hypothetical protein
MCVHGLYLRDMATPRQKRTGEMKLGRFSKDSLPKELTITGSYAITGGRPARKYPENAVEIIDEYIEWCMANDRVPFKEALRTRKYFNVSADLWLRWEEEHPEFNEASKRLEEMQRFQLMETSLRSKSNVIAAIFQLKVNHGMIETEKRIQQNEGNVTFSWGGEAAQIPPNAKGELPKKEELPVLEAEIDNSSQANE